MATEKVKIFYIPDDFHLIPRAPDAGEAVRQHARRPPHLHEARQEALHVHAGGRQLVRGAQPSSAEEDGEEEEV